MSQSTKIGRIASITGNLISIKLDDNIKSIMPIINGIVYRIGQIGSFLKVPLGYTNLYGVVNKIGADAIPSNLINSNEEEKLRAALNARWISMILVGECVGNKFERGVTQFPTADDEVHFVTIEDLSVIYSGTGNDSSICLGSISVSESLPAIVDIDKLLTRHCAIVGSTGSGKSNATAVLLEAIAKGSFSSERMLIIDPHGEYSEALKEFSRVFKIDAETTNNQIELTIPFWALPFEELLKIFPGNLNDINKDYLRTKILEYKIEASKSLPDKPSVQTITADSPIPFCINELWFELDDYERQTFSNQERTNKTTLQQKGTAIELKSNIYQPATTTNSAPYLNHKAKGILGFLDGMRNRLLDNRFRFLFQSVGLIPDKKGKMKQDLSDLLLSWLGHEKPITILDLSGIPSEIMTSISGTVLKIIYDALFWGQSLPVGGRKQPLLLILEEAHNYLKAGENSISSRTVQTIAKEGRKYGVGLLLVTQRPSELDETVLSQCGTIIALRMTNSGDKSHVMAAIQDDLGDMISILPSLRTGEAIIIGEAVKLPSRVKFEKLAHSPKSIDPIPSKEWKNARPAKEHYQKLVDNWRKQKF